MVIFKMTAGAAGFGILEIRCVDDARPSGHREGFRGQSCVAATKKQAPDADSLIHDTDIFQHFWCYLSVFFFLLVEPYRILTVASVAIMSRKAKPEPPAPQICACFGASPV